MLTMTKHIHGSYWDDLWLKMEYWERGGDDEETALSKAFWWDCVEVWHYDKSWDEEKTRFYRAFQRFYPQCKVPNDD